MRVNVSHTHAPNALPHHQSASEVYDRIVVCRRVRRSDSATFGANLKLPRSQSCGYIKPAGHSLRRSCSASYDKLNGEEFGKQRDESAPKLNVSITEATVEFDVFDRSFSRNDAARPFSLSQRDLLEPSLLGIRPEPPDWPARDEMIRDCIARRANNTELPFSLRMLKKKQRLKEEEGSKGEASGGSDSSSANKAFAATVYIIRELQSNALYRRGIALDEDMDGIIDKVQREMNSSFIWLFREVFSRTPDLMVDVMLLMANFTVYSMEKPIVVETLAPPSPRPSDSKINGEIPSTITKNDKEQNAFENKPLLIGAQTIDELSRTIQHPKVTPEEGLPLFEIGEVVNGSEVELWNSMVEEASRMQGEWKDEGLDRGTTQQFVSPVSVEIEADDYVEYHRTDLLYQIGVSEEPNNPLLLSNYAQFLYLIARDYDRAEECFQRAIKLDSTDAETLSQHATFLWLVRKDLLGAEERYLQAMAAEPENPYHVSRYASFLWNTGGDDTCYPLDISHSKN
ncbi:hypothetical protein Ancab_005944 [Ancistrocladus abbreviatus]